MKQWLMVGAGHPGVSIAVVKESEALEMLSPFLAVLEVSTKISVCYVTSKLESQNASKDEGDFE